MLLRNLQRVHFFGHRVLLADSDRTASLHFTDVINAAAAVAFQSFRVNTFFLWSDRAVARCSHIWRV